MSPMWIVFIVVLCIVSIFVGLLKYRDRCFLAALKASICSKCDKNFDIIDLDELSVFSKVDVSDSGGDIKVGYQLSCKKCNCNFFVDKKGQIVEEVVDGKDGL